VANVKKHQKSTISFSEKMAGARLDLAEKVISVQPVASQEENEEFLLLGEVKEMLSEAPRAERDDFGEVDLSFSALGNDDLPEVVSLVKLLPNCHVVNLAGLALNEAAVPAIHDLTQMDCMRYVVITSTALASTACWRAYAYDGDEEEAHTRFTLDDLKKLIFVSTPAWLEAGHWRSTVTNQKMQTVVVNTHKLFYKECLDLAVVLSERTNLVLGLNVDGDDGDDGDDGYEIDCCGTGTGTGDTKVDCAGFSTGSGDDGSDGVEPFSGCSTSPHDVGSLPTRCPTSDSSGVSSGASTGGLDTPTSFGATPPKMLHHPHHHRQKFSFPLQEPHAHRRNQIASGKADLHAHSTLAHVERASISLD
jgi:hypothetical protein